MPETKANRKRHGYNPLLLTVTSGKGGVGKTTLAVNLGTYWASKGRRILVVDGDLGLANVDIMFGIKPAYTFKHVLSGEKTISDVIVRGPGGIHILPASSGISEMVNLDAAQQMMVIGQLETLEDQYNVILIDTAAGIGSSVLNFAASAQFVLVLVAPEPTSLADSYAIIKVLREKHNVSRFQLVVNMAKGESVALKVYQKLSAVADSFIDVVIDYLGFIPQDESIPRSISSQRPFIEMYPSAPGSVALRKLADAILAKRSRS